MSGTITQALRTAQSGLLTTQSAVDAVANNIANVNTEGYSRKIVNMEQRVLAGVGAGVQLTDFTRAVDEGLIKDLRREYSDTYILDAQTSFFDRLEALLGTPEANTSISHITEELNKAAESLALSPTNTLEQNEFVRWANEVALKLNDMSAEIQALRGQADSAVSAGVDEVNRLLDSIASQNDKIIRNKAITHDVTDLEDQRDVALNELSKWMDISYYKRGDGDVVVFGGTGASLVDRTARTLTHTAITSVGATSTYAEGDINAIYVEESVAENDITDRILGGRLAGLIEQRDGVLPSLQAQLDEMASELRDAINLLHNRGTSFPGQQSLTGTRTFIDSANQAIKISGTADVAISLFDNTGAQQATTTLDTIMQSGSFGSGVQTSHGYWNVDEVAQGIEDWLQANGAPQASVSVNSDNKFELELSNSSLFIAFRDQSATTAGSSAADVSVEFDSDGDGDTDETGTGFANFFGLNDLYVDATDDTLLESSVLSGTWTAPGSTITFYDTAAGTGTALGSVTISAGSTLKTIASTINNADIGITASVIPDGSGYRLRLLNDNGRATVVTQGSSDTLLTSLSMKTAEVRSAGTLAVRTSILSSPTGITTGAVLWDSTANAYYTAAGDNTTAQQMADMLSSKNRFDTSGGLLARNESFSEYASSILADISGRSSTNSVQLESQMDLSDSLKLKAANFSGVNLDEEMSNLIMYQQAYSASARVISVIQQLFDELNNIF